MNIFKILGSGHGSVKEPSVSAFLGYLLNPSADHGLNSVFLEKVLAQFLELRSEPLKDLFSHSEEIVDEEMYILDMSYLSRFKVEVFLEKALKEENEKQEIVDIIVKITQRPKKKLHDISYLFNEEIPVALILIETKIKNSNSITFSQIKAQYELTLKLLPKFIPSDKWELWKNKICTILVSTNNENELIKFRKDVNPNSIHLYWNKTNEPSIKDIILEVLSHNEKGQISPIPSYTCETLKALTNFIENDFSSNTDDQQKEPKNFNQNISTDYNLFKSDYLYKFNEKQWIILDAVHLALQQDSEINLRYSTTHPIAIFENQKPSNKLFSFGPNLQVHLPLRKKLFKNHEISTLDIDKLKTFLENLNFKNIHVSKTDNVMIASNDDLSYKTALETISFFRNFHKTKLTEL